MNINTILIIIGAVAFIFILLIGFFVIATADKEKDTKVDSIFHKELRRKALADTLYACVNWPDIQFLMGRSGFLKNAVLIRTLAGEDVDSTYMVPLFLFNKGEETGMLYKGFSFPESQEHENEPDAGIGYNGMVFIPTKTTVYPAEN